MASYYYLVGTLLVYTFFYSFGAIVSSMTFSVYRQRFHCKLIIMISRCILRPTYSVIYVRFPYLICIAHFCVTDVSFSSFSNFCRFSFIRSTKYRTALYSAALSSSLYRFNMFVS